MEDKKVLTVFKPIAPGILFFFFLIDICFFCARQQQTAGSPLFAYTVRRPDFRRARLSLGLGKSRIVSFRGL